MTVSTAPDVDEESHASRIVPMARSAGRILVAVVGAIVIFGAFMELKGVDPISAYRDMWDSEEADESECAL